MFSSKLGFLDTELQES